MHSGQRLATKKQFKNNITEKRCYIFFSTNTINTNCSFGTQMKWLYNIHEYESDGIDCYYYIIKCFTIFIWYKNSLRQSYLEKLLAEKIQMYFIKHKLEIDGIGNFYTFLNFIGICQILFFLIYNKQYKSPVIILNRVSIIAITLFLFSVTFRSLLFFSFSLLPISIIFNMSYFARICTRQEFLENISIFGDQIFAVGFRCPAVTTRCLSVTQIRWEDDGTQERCTGWWIPTRVEKCRSDMPTDILRSITRNVDDCMSPLTCICKWTQNTHTYIHMYGHLIVLNRQSRIPRCGEFSLRWLKDQGISEATQRYLL